MKTSALLEPLDPSAPQASHSVQGRVPAVSPDQNKRKLRFKEFLHLLDQAEAEAASKTALVQQGPLKQ